MPVCQPCGARSLFPQRSNRVAASRVIMMASAGPFIILGQNPESQDLGAGVDSPWPSASGSLLPCLRSAPRSPFHFCNPLHTHPNCPSRRSPCVLDPRHPKPFRRPHKVRIPWNARSISQLRFGCQSDLQTHTCRAAAVVGAGAAAPLGHRAATAQARMMVARGPVAAATHPVSPSSPTPTDPSRP